MVNGVRTEVISTTAQAVAAGSVPKTALESNAVSTLASGVLTQAIAGKQQIEQNLMKQNPHSSVWVSGRASTIQGKRRW